MATVSQQGAPSAASTSGPQTGETLTSTQLFPPLTTVFTAPAHCQSAGFTTQTTNSSLSLYKLEDLNCLPPGYSSRVTFSPGICPDGYTTDWTSRSGEPNPITMAQCCPSGFHAQLTSDHYCSSLFNSTDSGPILATGPTTVTTDLSVAVDRGTAFSENIIVWYEQSDLTLFSSTSTAAGALTTSGYTAPASSTAGRVSSTSSSSSTATAGSGASGGLSTGAKAGIGAGVAGAAVLAIAVAVLLLWKKRRGKKDTAAKEQVVEYTGKAELDGTGVMRKPGPEVTEISGAEQHRRDIAELDSVDIYEAPGYPKREHPHSSTQSGSQADTVVAGVSGGSAPTAEPPIPPAPDAATDAMDSHDPPATTTMPPPANGDFGTATTLEDLELRYLEAEERRIQERRLLLLQRRVSPVVGGGDDK